MKPSTFDRFAGLCAVLAGVSTFLYAVSFVIITRSAPAMGVLLSALFLLLSGLLATPVLTSSMVAPPLVRCNVKQHALAALRNSRFQVADRIAPVGLL